MRDRKSVSVPMPQSMKEAIENQLGHGEYKTEYMRDAALEKLEADGVDTTQIRIDIEDPDEDEESEAESGNTTEAAAAD